MKTRIGRVIFNLPVSQTWGFRCPPSPTYQGTPDKNKWHRCKIKMAIIPNCIAKGLFSVIYRQTKIFFPTKIQFLSKTYKAGLMADLRKTLGGVQLSPVFRTEISNLASTQITTTTTTTTDVPLGILGSSLLFF